MQIKKRRSKKQQKRKEKEKKQRKRVAPEKATVAPSTMGGRLGEMVDRYRRMTMKEYNDVVEMCQMHGVPVSKAVLGKGEAVQPCSFLKNMAGFIDQAAVHLMHWSILPVAFPPPGIYPWDLLLFPIPRHREEGIYLPAGDSPLPSSNRLFVNIDQINII